MMQKLVFIVLLLFSQLVCFASGGITNEQFVFECITNEDGLSSNNITCLYQDKKGFLWIGTKAGLNRYDGKNFLVFKNNPQDTSTMSANKILGICEDNHENIWVATEYGVTEIIRDTYECRRFCIDKDDIRKNYIQGIFCDSQGNIWIKNRERIQKLCPQNEELRSFSIPMDFFKEELNEYPTPIFQDSDGILWFGGESGLCYYEPLVDDFIYFKADSLIQGCVSDNSVLCVFEDAQGLLWIGTQNGLNVLDKRTRKFSSFFYSETSKSIVNGIADDISGNKLWITTESNGLYLFDKQKHTFTNYTHTEKRTSISTNQTNCILKSSENILWTGTQNGLNKVDLKPKRFQLIGNEDGDYGLKYSYTTAIYSVNNRVFFGTKFGGLQIYDLEKRTKNTYSADKGNFPTNFILAIIKYSEDEVLIGSDGYLTIYNTETEQFTPFEEIIPELKAFCLTQKRINCLLSDSEGNIWIGTNSGIVLYDKKHKRVIHFGEEHLPSPIVTCIYENYKNRIFIGTEDGVSVYDKKGDTFTKVLFPQNLFTDFNKHVYDITEDYSGIVWFGTNMGLIRCNAINLTTESYTTNDGLKSNVIVSILANKNELWLGTDNGLAEFQPDSGICKTYALHDGIQEYEFSPRSAFKTMNGIMFFGGTQGINIFHPDSIHVKSLPPNVEFLQLEYTLNDKKYNVILKDGKKVRIPWNSSNIIVSFAALDFTEPQMNQYKYYIPEQTEDWIDLGNQNYINLVKLPIGNYQLNIRASNDDGVWADAKIVEIIVSPPFWRTTLAYILEALLIAGIALLIAKRIKHNVDAKNLRLQEKQILNDQLQIQKVEIEAKNKNILDSITYAERIQLAIMPARAKFKQLLPSSFILYLPKDIVSGDFYWITEIDEKIFIACSDCTGHGVPGAFMSIIGYNLLRSITKDRKIHKASEILDYLNKSIIELLSKNELDDKTAVKDGMDISICVFHKDTCVLEYAGAISRMFIIRNNQIISIRGNKYPVGLSNEQDELFTNRIIRVLPNDRFYMFSDGYLDQFGGPIGKKLKIKKFKQNILSCQHLPLIKHGNELKKQLKQWQGEWEQVDDILVMGFDFNTYLQTKAKREGKEL